MIVICVVNNTKTKDSTDSKVIPKY